MTLAETQELFHRAITGPVPLDEAELDRCFSGTGELPAGDRVAIYRNMYTARLVDALRETFRTWLASWARSGSERSERPTWPSTPRSTTTWDASGGGWPIS